MVAVKVMGIIVLTFFLLSIPSSLITLCLCTTHQSLMYLPIFIHTSLPQKKLTKREGEGKRRKNNDLTCAPGLDLSNIPKPKEYPPLTFELYHSRRRCYYITASSKEEFDDWVAQFRTCCWHARGYTLEDKAHIV